MPTSAATRVSDLVKHDHQELKTYYDNIKKAQRDDEKIKWQNQFVWELARHSVAEELVVYPAFEKHIPGGPRMAEKDRSEHQQVCYSSLSLPLSQPMQPAYLVLTMCAFQVKEKLYEFQSMSPSDVTFDPTIDSLWEKLSQHITEEERDDLPALEKALDADESGALARSFDRTKLFVPTRSHPSAPDRPPYETAAGLMSAPIDKLMDMFRKFPEGK
jgi:hypothetical protein